MSTASETRRRRATVPLAERFEWTLPELAAVLGVSATTIYRHLTVDDSGHRGTIHRPGGVEVPCHKDTCDSQWRVYRRQFEAAVERALEGAP